MIGIDGGGTKTEAVLYHLDRGEISRIICEGSNPHSTSFKKSVAIVIRLIGQLLPSENIHAKEDYCIGIGIAGLGREEDKMKWKAEFNKRNKFSVDESRIAIENDALVALYSGTYGKDGIISICGTGAICYGINKERTCRVGGWGHLIGADPGSGYYIGHESIQAIFREYDHLGPKTIMTRLLLDKFKETEVPQLIKHIYNNDHAKVKIASIAKITFEAAIQADDIANKIIEDNIKIIVMNAIILFTRLFKEDQLQHHIPFIAVGGVFQNSLMHLQFKEILNKELKNVDLIYPTMLPVYGALVLALKTVGYEYKSIKKIFDK